MCDNVLVFNLVVCCIFTTVEEGIEDIDGSTKLIKVKYVSIIVLNYLRDVWDCGDRHTLKRRSDGSRAESVTLTL